MVHRNVLFCCAKKTMLNGTEECFWDPTSLLIPDNLTAKYALIILNQPINFARDLMISLWNRALVRITVDGGTNRWLHFITQCSSEERCLIEHQSPDIICGDLDSLDQSVLQSFNNVIVKKTPDQSETDFTKSLKILNDYLKESKTDVDGVIAVCDTAGRFDQIMANINTLFKSKRILNRLPVYQLAGDSLTWLLRPGHHTITIKQKLLDSFCWCSLIPIGEKATCVSTTGLRWNLDHRSMEFGELVSTSNTYSGEPQVTVTTETNLIWSMGLGHHNS